MTTLVDNYFKLRFLVGFTFYTPPLEWFATVAIQGDGILAT